MLAVLADPSLFDDLALMRDTSEIASISSTEHFILAAPAEALPQIEAALRARAIPTQALPFGYAFHSRWIDPAGARDRHVSVSRTVAAQARLVGKHSGADDSGHVGPFVSRCTRPHATW